MKKIEMQILFRRNLKYLTDNVEFLNDIYIKDRFFYQDTFFYQKK